MAVSMEQIKELREKTGVGLMECKKALSETNGDIEASIRLLKERGAITAAKKTDREVKEGSIGFYINDAKNEVACIELHCETDFVAKNELFVNLSKEIAKISAGVDNASVESVLNASGENGSTVQAMITEGIQKWGENTVLASVKSMKTDGFFGSYVHFNNKLVTIVEFNVKPNDKCLEIANQIAMHVASEKPLALNREGVDANAVAEQKEIFAKQVEDKPENMREKIIEGKMNSWYSESVLIDQKLFTDNKITIKSLVEEIGKESGSTAEIKSFAIISLGV